MPRYYNSYYGQQSLTVSKKDSEGNVCKEFHRTDKTIRNDMFDVEYKYTRNGKIQVHNLYADKIGGKGFSKGYYDTGKLRIIEGFFNIT